MLAQLLNLEAINGMATLLEHMVFKGTEELGSGEFERQIEGVEALLSRRTSWWTTPSVHITTAPKILPPWHRYKSM